jgi:hypothetical protein
MLLLMVLHIGAVSSDVCYTLMKTGWPWSLVADELRESVAKDNTFE